MGGCSDVHMKKVFGNVAQIIVGLAAHQDRVIRTVVTNSKTKEHINKSGPLGRRKVIDIGTSRLAVQSRSSMCSRLVCFYRIETQNNDARQAGTYPGRRSGQATLERSWFVCCSRGTVVARAFWSSVFALPCQDCTSGDRWGNKTERAVSPGQSNWRPHTRGVDGRLNQAQCVRLRRVQQCKRRRELQPVNWHMSENAVQKINLDLFLFFEKFFMETTRKIKKTIKQVVI